MNQDMYGDLLKHQESPVMTCDTARLHKTWGTPCCRKTLLQGHASADEREHPKYARNHKKKLRTPEIHKKS